MDETAFTAYCDLIEQMFETGQLRYVTSAKMGKDTSVVKTVVLLPPDDYTPE